MNEYHKGIRDGFLFILLLVLFSLFCWLVYERGMKIESCKRDVRSMQARLDAYDLRNRHIYRMIYALKDGNSIELKQMEDDRKWIFSGWSN